MELANHYAELRKIPLSNLIYVDLPDRLAGEQATMTPEEFRTLIYEPANQTLKDRFLQGHILVWLYSLDFPVIINTSPPMSLTGMTFVRGRPPATDDIRSGRWLSPLFRGPDRPDGPAAMSISLEQFTLQLTTNMPLPSMLLGWSGARGMPLPRIVEQLRRAASADGALPDASVYFELNNNVRSTARRWQFEPAASELGKLNVTAIVSSNRPAQQLDLMGIVAGQAQLDPAAYGTLRPGAYADHLTSFGAVFSEGTQTKLTAWLRHGAAASCGTITEPGSLETPVVLWTKFPSARIHAHYAQGCTMLESLYQATRSPLQVLFVGDALCAPWTRAPGLAIVSMADDDAAPLKGRAEFITSAWAGSTIGKPMFLYLLNGLPLVNNQPQTDSLTLDSSRIPDGYHALRAVGYINRHVRFQGFATRNLSVNNRGRSALLGGYAHKQKVDLNRPLTFAVSAEGDPSEIGLTAQGHILARVAYTSNTTLTVQSSAVGGGPVHFQAIAFYRDGQTVHSAPLLLHVENLNQPPDLDTPRHSTDDDGTERLVFAATDPEQDPLRAFWSYNLLTSGKKLMITPAGSIEKTDAADGGWTLSAKSGAATATLEPEQPHLIRELRTRMTITGRDALANGVRAGLVMNFRDPDNYLFWGVQGSTSAWVFQRVMDGKTETLLSRGAPLETGITYDLGLSQDPNGRLTVSLDHQAVAQFDAAFGPGRVGVLSHETPCVFNHVLVAPVSACQAGITENVRELVKPNNASWPEGTLFAVAEDGRAESRITWTPEQP